MITINLLNNSTNERFSKKFYSKKIAEHFLKKVNKGKKLTLLSIEMWDD